MNCMTTPNRAQHQKTEHGNGNGDAHEQKDGREREKE